MFLAVGALLAQGCGTKSCSLVDADSGVEFDVTATFAAAPGLLRVHACIESTCVDRPVGPSDPPGFFVPDPSLGDPSMVQVGVTIRDAAGAFVMRARRRVQLQSFMPNGAGCDPTRYRAHVATTDSGALTQAGSGAGG
jgi:hypothetical protein